MRLRLCVAGAAVVAIGLISLSIARDEPGFTFAGDATGAVALLGAGWSLTATGIGFAASRPGNRVGPLLVAAGAAWLVVEWGNPGSGSDIAFTIGQALFPLAPPLVVWAMLAYPSGRLIAIERVIVSAAFVAFVAVLGVAPALFFDPTDEFCSQCPDNLALITGRATTADRFADAGFRFSAATAAAAIGAAAVRFARSGAARRRVAAPVVAAGSVYLVAIIWTCLRSADRSFIGNGAIEHRLWLVQAIAMTALAFAVAWGRATVRRTRASLARLVVELSETAGRGGLRALLARALDDGTLHIVYPVGDDRFADAVGQRFDMPPTDGHATTPIIREGVPIAILLHRQGLLDDHETVDEVASAVRLALDNERLQAALRVQESDLRASRVRVIAATDGERRRLERDLHDGAQQRLVALLIGLRMAGSDLARREADGADLLAAAATELQATVDALRGIAHGIHPAVLTDEGLAAALDALAETGQFPVRHTGIPEEPLPDAVEHVAYRIVADAARTGRVDVTAGRRDGQLTLAIEVSCLPESIVELQDRVGALDGQLDIERSDGTIRLRAAIPCEVVPCG